MSTLKANAIQTLAGKPIVNSTGSILQVVHTPFPGQFVGTASATGTGYYVDVAGLSAAITPSSANNKILIMTNMYVGITSAGSPGYQQHFRIKRNGIPILVGDGVGSRPTATGRVSTYDPANAPNMRFRMVMLGGVHYDSPGSTSEQIYQIALGGYSENPTVYVNRQERFQNALTDATSPLNVAGNFDSTPVSTLTLMEVSA
jgi:hypothetical protein